MRRLLASGLLVSLATACAPSVPTAPPNQDPSPRSVAEFRAAAQRVLDETGVPGAGVALVRQSGVEWAGGVGFADRDRRTPVTADTHFRAGSISKTFVAMAFVQLAEDGDLDLDAPVSQVAPLVEIDNPWDDTDPVRIIHLLQHTAGFDDMHFNEAYNLVDPADLPLEEVLHVNPRSRRVRWRPGTRMSYSNPGYGVAGYVLEQATGERFEDVIRTKIFEPVGMTTSSFTLTASDEASLARGYDARGGPPVPFSQIYLRPAGNLHTSPAELGKFVQLLINWGETSEELVVDPEYLSNMEHPRTTLASRAGLLNGYGSAIFGTFAEPFPLLGHDGGILGFSSTYAYSPARDVGYVVLLNASYSQEALRRIASLAIRYLKADVEPPAKPRVTVPLETLRRYEGYYHDASPRNQAVAFLEWLLVGRTVTVEGDTLVATPVVGRKARLVPVTDTLFRLDTEVDATRVFTQDDRGTLVLTGGALYAERTPRWRVEIVRVPVLASLVVVLSPLLVGIAWVILARWTPSPGFWTLKSALLLCALAVLTPAVAVGQAPGTGLGTANAWTVLYFAGTIAIPAAALLSLGVTIDAWRRDVRRWLGAYALLVSFAALVVSGYLYAWGMIGFRSWDY